MKNTEDIIDSFGILNMALNYNVNKNIIFNFSINNILNKVYVVANRPYWIKTWATKEI